MDSTIIQENGLRSKRVGKRAATIAGIGLLILLLIPIFFYQDPPPGQPGILVNLGLPDQGQGDENAQASAAQPAEPTPPEQSQPEPTPPQPEPDPQPDPAPTTPPDDPQVVQQEDPSAVALRERKEREARERAEAERKEREAREEAARKEREAREAAERAAAEQRAREEAANNTRDQIGGLFGSGSGKGNTGTAGNQGDPNGDPNADRVNGISTGNGNVTGLGGRSIVAAPPVTGRTQDAGTVVVRICVNSSGKVTSAKYTVSGSRGATPTLIKLAEANAKRYKFSPGELDSQCGKITYVFKVQ